MTGTKTNVIAAARVTDRFHHDSPQFAPLVNKVAEGSTLEIVTAEKAFPPSVLLTRRMEAA